MIEYKNINAGESGVSIRAKLNNMFKALIEGNEGVNNIWEEIVKLVTAIRETNTNIDNSYNELREQVLNCFDHTDTSVDDLMTYINGMNGGISGFAVDTSFVPNFPEGKSVTVLAAGAGTFEHFLDINGNPITINDTDALTVFYKGEDSTYWKYKSVYARVGITNFSITTTTDSVQIVADKVSTTILPATEHRAGVISAGDKKKLDAEMNITGIKADLSNLDYIKDSGIYNLDNKRIYDNSPIDNQGAISARMTVLVTESDGNKVITQVLNLNNNVGGEGNVYIRSCRNGEWKAWGKLQTNVEVGVVNQEQLDALVDNGIYSGILSTTGETFVIICINNYAIAQEVGIHHISHLKYSLVVGTGEVKIEKRTRDAYGFWTDWEAIKSVSDVDDTTITEIKSKAVEADSLNFQTRANVVALDYKTIEGVGDEIIIPAATTKSAGVMSAEDKKALDEHSESIIRILGLESRVDFNDSVVGSSNTFFDLSEPIQVVKGEKLKFKIELTATNNNTLIAYLWSSNTYVTAGYDVSANLKEITFTITADATITSISLRGDTVLNGSISTTVVEGEVAKIQHNTEEINRNAEEIQQIVSTGYDSAIVEGSYLSNVGYATSDAGYKCTDFIPVIEGATLSVTGRKVCAYNENKQFVSALSNSGGDIIIPSQVRYIRVDAAKTSVLDITRDGSPLLGVALLQDVCNANNSFKNIYSKYTLSSGYYAAGSGIAQANSAYVKTDHIRVSGNVYFNIRCLRACFYDADKKFLSSVESAKEHVVVPENAVYVTFSYPKTDVEGKNLVIYGDRINEFIVYKDEFETAIKQLREEVADAYVTQYTNNLTNEQDSTVTVVSGEYGAVGAKYSLPVKCTGKYSLHFEFKYPANVDGSRKEILRFDNIAGSVKGGCRVYLDNLGYTIAEQQIRSGRVVALAPITSDNNYVARIGTSTSYASLQTGNDAFSLRYLGSDQTATMSITENGLLFRGVAEVNDIPFPANASMLDFANTLKTMCSEGGSLNGVFDFAAYDVFGRSTADLTKVANIPLYYTYSYGVDNFPVFVPYNDDNWHSVDIVFDSSATKGWDLLSFFFDGHIVNYVDNGFTLTGNGVFNTNVTIGGDGIAVRNLKYTDRCTKVDAPVISIEMLHNIKDELSLGGQDRISVSEIERVITVYKKHGYKHIPLSEISQYIRGNKALSGKYFCLVHDDYFYSSPKLLNLYKGMDCKVCFAIINELLLDEVADEYKKNSSQFEYAIHSETSYASLKYDSLVQKVRSDMANLGNRLNSITNMLVYPYGATNRGVGKVLFHEGITVALTVGDNRVSMNCNPMILPRMPSRATGAFENLDSQLANIDKYYKE